MGRAVAFNPVKWLLIIHEDSSNSFRWKPEVRRLLALREALWWRPKIGPALFLSTIKLPDLAGCGEICRSLKRQT